MKNQSCTRTGRRSGQGTWMPSATSGRTPTPCTTNPSGTNRAGPLHLESSMPTSLTSYCRRCGNTNAEKKIKPWK
ncbi:unnamed protein product [Ectocarpus sp. 12 AP-2014]